MSCAPFYTLRAAISIQIRFGVLKFVYKSCLHEVYAMLLFCKHCDDTGYMALYYSLREKHIRRRSLSKNCLIVSPITYFNKHCSFIMHNTPVQQLPINTIQLNQSIDCGNLRYTFHLIDRQIYVKTCKWHGY